MEYHDIEQIKRRYHLYCEIIPGLYKWKDKIIYIKKKERFDLSLLLTELIHAKSITQGKKYIEDQIKEGLPHYLAKLLCVKCSIPYKESAHRIYFQIWERIHKKFNLKVLVKILFTNNIAISIEILKNIFNNEKKDILEIPFEKAMKLLKV